METLQVYSISELSEEAKQRAIDDIRTSEIHYSDCSYSEIYDSLESLYRAAGVQNSQCRFGPNLAFDSNAQDFTGARAFAWLENNLLCKLRISRKDFVANRKKYMGYGRDYRVEKIKPCPFTGLYYDEDFLDRLKENITSGMTLEESFKELQDYAEYLCERIREFEDSNERIEECAISWGMRFTSDGEYVR